jgi:hypothetical protein
MTSPMAGGAHCSAPTNTIEGGMTKGSHLHSVLVSPVPVVRVDHVPELLGLSLLANMQYFTTVEPLDAQNCKCLL